MHWNMTYLVLSGNMRFLFPQRMTLPLRRKTKDDLPLKRYMEKWYFRQLFWKDGLFKNIALEYDISCITWRDGIFSKSIAFFLWEENKRWSFSRNTWKYDIFYIYMQVLQTWSCVSLWKEKSKMILSRKNRPKSDRHCRSTL